MSGSAPRRLRAFTLVELLVVVLILAILMAVALPLYLKAVQDSSRRTARSNMHTLICAEVAYRTQFQMYTSDINVLVSTKQLESRPIGPGNLTYAVYTADDPALPDTRSVPSGGVAACGLDGTAAPYGCYIPGVDSD